MKRFILIEFDSGYESLFAYSCKPVKGTFFEYERDVQPFVNHVDREKFFSMVNAALPSKSDIENAKPIKLENVIRA